MPLVLLVATRATRVWHRIGDSETNGHTENMQQTNNPIEQSTSRAIHARRKGFWTLCVQLLACRKHSWCTVNM